MIWLYENKVLLFDLIVGEEQAVALKVGQLNVFFLNLPPSQKSLKRKTGCLPNFVATALTHVYQDLLCIEETLAVTLFDNSHQFLGTACQLTSHCSWITEISRLKSGTSILPIFKSKAFSASHLLCKQLSIL